MRFALVFTLLSAVSAMSCGGSEESKGGSGGAADLMPLSTGEFTVPAGESLTCFYLDTTTKSELTVLSATGSQSLGGHHIIVFYIDAPRTPQHHQCTNEEMVSWSMIAGAASSNNGEPTIPLPEGVALKVPKGKQLGIQSHYINTTGKAQKVSDTLTLELGDPKNVREYANLWSMADTTFTIEPAASLTRKTVATVDRDLSSVLLFGHMHEFGRKFQLDEIDEHDQVVKTLYREEWTPSYATHPPFANYSLDNPFVLKKGTRLMQTCTWDNTTPDAMTFPREMCVGSGYYVPDAGQLVFDAQPLPSK